MLEDIITVCFIVVMMLNIIVAIRWWMMMRLMNFTLKGFIESNRQISEVLNQRDQHHDRPRLLPPDF